MRDQEVKFAWHQTPIDRTVLTDLTKRRNLRPFVDSVVQIGFNALTAGVALHAFKNWSWPLIVLGVLSLAIGFIALPLGGGFDGIGSFLFEASHGPHEFEFSVLWSLVGIVLAGGGLVAGWVLYAGPRERVDRIRERAGGLHRLLAERYYLDPIYQFVIDRVVLAMGRILAVFDRRFVNDVGVNGPGIAIVETGKRLRYHVTGLFADYGAAMAGGVALIALLMWLRS